MKLQNLYKLQHQKLKIITKEKLNNMCAFVLKAEKFI